MFKHLIAALMIASFLIAPGAQAIDLSCGHAECIKHSVTQSSAYDVASDDNTQPPQSPLDDCNHCALSHHHHADSSTLLHNSTEVDGFGEGRQLVAWNDRFYFNIDVEPSVEPPSHI